MAEGALFRDKCGRYQGFKDFTRYLIILTTTPGESLSSMSGQVLAMKAVVLADIGKVVGLSMGQPRCLREVRFQRFARNNLRPEIGWSSKHAIE